jgi:hypothetical protein
MKLIRTEQIWLEPNDTLSELCHYSKNLWNEANYLVRQAFFAGNRIPKCSDLAGTFKRELILMEVSSHEDRF